MALNPLAHCLTTVDRTLIYVPSPAQICQPDAGADVSPHGAFIVTLALDTASAQRLTAWRARFFPTERNYLEAHLTLFHRLPEAELGAVDAALLAAAQNQEPFELQFHALRREAAFISVVVAAPLLLALKKSLNQNFAAYLSAQDKQPLRPHVTVMNKSTTEQAAVAMAILEVEFSPWQGRATGLCLHRYLGGPWDLLKVYPFLLQQPECD